MTTPIERNMDDLFSSASDEFIECRAIKHAWETRTDTRNESKGVAEWLLRCTRCGTTRTDRFNPNTGALFDRSYVYPDGYQLAGIGTITIDQLRVELTNRYHFVGGRRK